MRTVLKNEQGAVLLFTVLVIGLAAVSMMSILATAGFNGFADADQQVSSQEVRAKLFGCLDELLVQFNEDPDFSPSSINTLDATCSVAVVDEGGDNRSADISLTTNNFTRSLHIEAEVNGVHIFNIVEE